MKLIMIKIIFVVLTASIMACAGVRNLTVINRSEGVVLNAFYEPGWGETQVTVTMTNSEILKGRLTWIPPNGGISTTLMTANNVSGTATGMSIDNKGMYIGTLVGNKGTTMRVELLCNAFAGTCVGIGQSNLGNVYDIQL